MIYMCSLFY